MKEKDLEKLLTGLVVLYFLFDLLNVVSGLGVFFYLCRLTGIVLVSFLAVDSYKENKKGMALFFAIVGVVSIIRTAIQLLA